MDKDSPAYIPSLFSFTDSSTKKRAEQALARWEAAKRRGKKDEPKAIETSEQTEDWTTVPTDDSCVDSMVVTDSIR